MELPDISASAVPDGVRRTPSQSSSVRSMASEENYRRIRTSLEYLGKSEYSWRHLHPWIKEKGYELRPRFRKGWTPSWKGTKKDPNKAEDGQRSTSRIIMDAVRISDNTTVCFKLDDPDTSPLELQIARLLSSERFSSDPRNHCVPLLDVLDLPENAGRLMVMPLLRPWHSPSFETVGEIVSFIEQIFEGLKFMHEQNIAHRDCTYNNIMFDATSMYPEGFHPTERSRSRDLKGRAKHYTRTQRPVRYYFIDFGFSKQYDPKDGPPLDYPVIGGDKSPPEHRRDLWNTRCNPFPTDIYFLGNLIRQRIMTKYTGLNFLTELTADMTREVPAERPTINEVVTRFEAIVKSLSWWKLRERVALRKDWRIVRMVKTVPYLYHTTGYVLTGMPAIPRPKVST